MERLRVGYAVSCAAIGFALSLTGCVKTEYVGNGSKGFWSESPAQIPPNIAFSKAQPYLAATWEARCEKLRMNDEWCEKPPVDLMVRRGNYYYVTRTSYPYKEYDALTQYAVRVHVESGEVIPYE